jgi:major type 1 subunit fimbrin (pilin)
VKKNLLLAALLAAGVTGQVFAADVNISLNGGVIDTTCLVNGSATGTAAAVTVTMPKLSKAQVAANALGPILRSSASTLKLTNCPTTSNVGLVFDAGSNWNFTSLGIKNAATTGASQGVDVQLVDANNAVINANNTASTTYITPAADGSATYTFGTQYVRNGEAPAAGTYTSTVNAWLVYQ